MPARKALIFLMLAAVPGLAGCGGGGDATYEEVTLPPPALSIPKDSGTAKSSASATATPTVTPTATPASGSTGSTGATSGGTTGTTTPSTGGTTGGAGTQTTTQPQDTGGATADQGLDQFCADNPGACDGGTQNP